MKRTLIIALALLMAACEPKITETSGGDPVITYVGRTDFSDPDAPKQWAAGGYFTFGFEGGTCLLGISDHRGADARQTERNFLRHQLSRGTIPVHSGFSGVAGTLPGTEGERRQCRSGHPSVEAELVRGHAAPGTNLEKLSGPENRLCGFAVLKRGIRFWSLCHVAATELSGLSRDLRRKCRLTFFMFHFFTFFP